MKKYHNCSIWCHFECLCVSAKFTNDEFSSKKSWQNWVWHLRQKDDFWRFFGAKKKKKKKEKERKIGLAKKWFFGIFSQKIAAATFRQNLFMRKISPSLSFAGRRIFFFKILSTKILPPASCLSFSFVLMLGHKVDRNRNRLPGIGPASMPLSREEKNILTQKWKRNQVRRTQEGHRYK